MMDLICFKERAVLNQIVLVCSAVDVLYRYWMFADISSNARTVLCVFVCVLKRTYYGLSQTLDVIFVLY